VSLGLSYKDMLAQVQPPASDASDPGNMHAAGQGWWGANRLPAGRKLSVEGPVCTGSTFGSGWQTTKSEKSV
jgi:hypothetical protein